MKIGLKSLTETPDFKKPVEQLHELLCEYGDPHTVIVIRQDMAEVYTAEAGVPLKVMR